MSTLCENRWEALRADDDRLYTWLIPTPHGIVKMRMRHGSVGFVMACFIAWYAEKVEPLAGKVLDDWSYAWRFIRGTNSGPLSNHAGYAVDLNALKHVMGKFGTFLKWQTIKIKAKLLTFGGIIVWGEFWTRPDGMHFEIGRVSMAKVEKKARRLMKTRRGRDILGLNPTQRAVILSD